MNWTPDRCFRLAIASIAQCPGPRGDRPAAAGAAPARRALRLAGWVLAGAATYFGVLFATGLRFGQLRVAGTGSGR